MASSVVENVSVITRSVVTMRRASVNVRLVTQALVVKKVIILYILYILLLLTNANHITEIY